MGGADEVGEGTVGEGRRYGDDAVLEGDVELAVFATRLSPGMLGDDAPPACACAWSLWIWAGRGGTGCDDTAEAARLAPVLEDRW